MFKALSLGAIVAAKRFGCRDEKQWGSCLTAYANKECLDGCDRTCGKCSTEICYDMIPQPHDKFWHDGITVKSEWPNFMNDGGNTLPSKTEDIVNDLYPFKSGAVSEFCVQVFKKHLCGTQDLVLTYSDESSTHDIVLTGFGYEYCRFSCGRCTQTAGCYETHNSAMQFLARDPDADTNFNNFNFDNFNWDGEGESESWDFGGDIGEEAPEESEEEDTSNAELLNDPVNNGFGFFEEDTEWDFGAFDWGFGRKRRAVDNLPKAELLKAALENIVAGLNYHTSPKHFAHVMELVRKRRQTLNQMGDVTAERQSKFDSINYCWINNQAEDYEAEEEEEEESEIESEGNADQYVDRRSINDNDGMQAYFNSKVNFEADEMEMVNCQYHPMPASEVYSGMDLHYDCTLKCNAGQVPRGYNPLAEVKEQPADVVLMKCHRTKSMEKKHQMPSVCNIPSHGVAGLSLICVADPDAEVEEEEAPAPASDAEIIASAESAFADYLASIDYYGYNY